MPASPVSPKRRSSRSHGSRDLHVGRQDRIGRRQHGAEQHGGTGRQTQYGHAEQRDAGDGDDHRYAREPQRNAPETVTEGQSKFQPGGKERHEHRQFGDPFEQRGVAGEVERQHAGRLGRQAVAEREIQHRARQREPLQHRRPERHEDQREPRQQIPPRKIHSSLPWPSAHRSRRRTLPLARALHRSGFDHRQPPQARLHVETVVPLVARTTP